MNFFTEKEMNHILLDICKKYPFMIDELMIIPFSDPNTPLASIYKEVYKNEKMKYENIDEFFNYIEQINHNVTNNHFKLCFKRIISQIPMFNSLLELMTNYDHSLHSDNNDYFVFNIINKQASLDFINTFHCDLALNIGRKLLKEPELIHLNVIFIYLKNMVNVYYQLDFTRLSFLVKAFDYYGMPNVYKIQNKYVSNYNNEIYKKEYIGDEILTEFKLYIMNKIIKLKDKTKDSLFMNIMMKIGYICIK